MIGVAKYNNDTVCILDQVKINGVMWYMINYGGPIWLTVEELSNIEFIQKKGA